MLQKLSLSPAVFSVARLAALGLVLALGAGVLSSCSTAPAGRARASGLHPRLGPFTYLEEGNLVTLAVGVEAARHRENESFVPIAIGVANNSLPSLTLTRESLTLVDDTDQRLALATVKEVKEIGSRTLLDLRLSNPFAQIFGGRLDAWPRVNAVFFPIGVANPEFRSRGIVSEQIELVKHSWMIDVVYFPHPAGRLLGRHYELWVDAEELEEPVFVKFAIE